MFRRSSVRVRRMRAAWVVLLAALMLPVTGAQDISFSGDDLEVVTASGRERTVLTGNARLVTEDSTITADRMELYSDFNYALCTGNVTVENTKNGIQLTANEVFYNRRDEVLQVQGNAVMLDRKNEIVVKGGFIEHWDQDEVTVIQIGVRILRKDLVCRAESARYLRAENKLELSGLPVVRLRGDEYRAARIYVDLNNDSVRLEGEVSGTVRSGSPQGDQGSGRE